MRTPLARSLSVEAAKSLVQAFISSRLNYCYAISHDLPDWLMRRLQSVYRTLPHGWWPVHHGATTSHRYCDSSTGYQCDDVSTSRSPSWFSSAWLVSHLVTWQRTVSSSPTSPLADFVQQTQQPMSRMSNTFGGQCFAAACPRLWNSLPINLRQCQSRTIQAVIKDIPV